jgi:hypothetical protein
MREFGISLFIPADIFLFHSFMFSSSLSMKIYTILLYILLSFLSFSVVVVFSAGSISLSSSVYNSALGQTSIPIDIIRSISSEGKIIINATTKDYTAISPVDYQGVAGSIEWPSGDDNIRRVNLQLKPSNRSLAFLFIITNISNGTIIQPSQAFIILNALNSTSNSTLSSSVSSSSTGSQSLVDFIAQNDDDKDKKNLGLGLGLGLGGGLIIILALTGWRFKNKQSQNRSRRAGGQETVQLAEPEADKE